MLILQLSAEDFPEEYPLVKQSGLSTGAIIGIVIGVIIGAGLLALVAYLFYFLILPFLLVARANMNAETNRNN